MEILNDNNVQVNVNACGPITMISSIYKTKVLTPCIINGINVIKQSDLANANTKYVIRYNFNLMGEEITVPKGCIIEFDGGSITDGTLICNNTIISCQGDIKDYIVDVALEGDYTIGGTEAEVANALADKKDTTDGMGKIYLKKNKPIQEQMTQSNTIYVIQYDFDLGGKELTVPENCVLEFDGGMLKNGSVVGNGTAIRADLVQIFSLNIELQGYWNLIQIYPEWFGAKGDYSYSEHTGTDDSAAISKAIKVANITLVNKVRLSSAYYINNTVNIESGDILIEGSYVTIREDLVFSNSTQDISIKKKSILVAGKNCTDIITIKETVTHPIWIRNVGLFNYDIYTRDLFNVCGIKFKSEYNGPTWPVVVEYCHFYGLDKAIFVSSEKTQYNIHGLKIRNSAFNYNTWCVYFDHFTGESYNKCWNFVFTDNYCHLNTFGLHIGISTGIAIINNNNFEGDLKNLPNGKTLPTEYSNYSYHSIRFKFYSKLEYKYNHHEQNNKNLLSIIGYESGNMKIDSKYNFFNPGPDCYDIVIKVNDIYEEIKTVYVSLDNNDFNKIHIEDNIHLSVDELSDNIFIKNGCFCIVSFSSVRPCDKIITPILNSNIVGNSDEYNFINGELYSNGPASPYYITNPHTLSENKDNNYLIIYAKPIINVASKIGEIYITGGNPENAPCYSSRKQYCAVIKNCSKEDNSEYKFYGFKHCDYSVLRNIGARIIKSDANIPINELLVDIDEGISFNSTELSKIVAKKQGNKVYLTDNKKFAIWNGSEWTNLDGTSLG